MKAQPKKDMRRTDEAMHWIKVADEVLRRGKTAEALAAWGKAADIYEERQYWPKLAAVVARIAAVSPSDGAVQARLARAQEGMGYRREAGQSWQRAAKLYAEKGDASQSAFAEARAAQLLVSERGASASGRM